MTSAPQSGQIDYGGDYNPEQWPAPVWDDDYAAFKDLVAQNAGWGLVRWCGDPACEAAIKEETKATSRNLPLAGVADPGPCLFCGNHADGPRWIFARAY